MYKTLFTLDPGRSGEAGNRESEMGLRMTQSAFRHGQCHIFADRAFFRQNGGVHAQKIRLGIFCICDKTPIERMRTALDIGQKRRDQPAGTALCCRNGPALVTDTPHRRRGALLQLSR